MENVEEIIRTNLGIAQSCNYNLERCLKKLDQVQGLTSKQLKKQMSSMLVEEKKSIDQIIQYWKETTQDCGSSPIQIDNSRPKQNLKSNQSNAIDYSYVQTTQPQLQHSQQSYRNHFTESSFSQLPLQRNQYQQNEGQNFGNQIYSGKQIQQLKIEENSCTLSFIFKSDDQNFRKAYENRNNYDEKFVLRIRDHINDKIRLNILSFKNIHQILKFSFNAEKKCSGGGDKEPLLPDVFQYDLLPSYIIAQWEPFDFDLIFSPNTRFSCEIKVDASQFPISGCYAQEQDKIKQRQFDNFSKYYQNIQNQKVQSFSYEQLQNAITQTKQKFFAIDSLLDILGDQLEQFTSTVFSSPKGILFYGPPGTGKSAISLKICQYLEVKLVTTPMAAGDFNKGIVGDSERMLNEIAERAQLIPWETCFLLVDEIDSLAPDRTADQGQGKDSSLLGVFLAILDGAKQTPNLKIFASTNLREKMDSAFLRRMEIQIFLGNPSALARLEWIKRKSKEAEDQLNFELSQKDNTKQKNDLLRQSLKDLKDFVQDSNKVRELQQITLNFSADALRKVLERFLHQIMIGKIQQKKIDIMNLMKNSVRFTANEMRIRIGKDLVVEIIDQIPNRQEFIQRNDELFRFIQNDGGPAENNEKLILSRRFIIDLSADMTESLQIETQRILDQQYVASSVKKLKTFKKDPRNRNRQEDIEDYRYLAKQFPNYQHIDQNKGRMKTLNSYRIQFLKNIEYLPSGTEFDPLEDYNHLIDSFIQQLNNPPSENLCRQLAKNFEELQKSWLQFIIVLSTSYIQADCVKLIDANYLYQNNISDDTGASRLIIDTVNQMKEYSKSVVIFDIDSIAGVSKQFSSMKKDISQPTNSAIEDNEGASFSYQKIRSNAMDISLKFGQNLLHSDGMWVFYVSNSKMMTLEIKNALNFQLTPKEKEFDDLQSEQDIQRRCGRCLSYYTDRENEEDQCGRHTQQLYSVSQFQILKFEKTESQKIKEKNGLKTEYINDLDIFNQCKKYSKKQVLSEVLKGVPISDFKYLCCQKQVFEKGEILSSHSEINIQNINQVNLLSDNTFDEL